jgi:hypothetical protein
MLRDRAIKWSHEANADPWKLVKKLRLIRVEYPQKASLLENQGFSPCC